MIKKNYCLQFVAKKMLLATKQLVIKFPSLIPHIVVVPSKLLFHRQHDTNIVANVILIESLEIPQILRKSTFLFYSLC